MTELDSKLDLISKKMNFKEKDVQRSFYELQKNQIIAKKVIPVAIYPIDSDSISLIPMADLHIGHKSCNLNKIRDHLAFINETKNCYTIILGDETETATRTSVGMGMFEEDIHIPDQVQLTCELLKPLAEKKKILGMVSGNHTMRVANLIGINLTQEIASILHTNYLGYQGFLDLTVGSQNYNIVAFHGSGGGAMNSSKVASAEKISKVVISDLYITGHSHIRHKTEDCIYEFKDGMLTQRTRHYVTCGSFLEYWGGYAEMKGLAPATTGSVCIELMANQKNIVVHI